MSDEVDKVWWLTQRKRYPDAIKYCQDALASDPENADLHLALAGALYHADRDPEALEVVRQVLALSPDWAWAHYYHGLILQANQKLREAVRAYQEALRLNPNMVESLNELADIYYTDYPYYALDLIEKALQNDPEDITSLFIFSRILSRLKRRNDAVKIAATALQIEPDNPRAHAAMGWAQVDKHRRRKARKHFREATRLDPTEAAWREGLIETSGTIERAGLGWADAGNVLIVLSAFFSIVALEIVGLENTCLFPTWVAIIVGAYVWVYFREKKRNKVAG